MQQPAKYSLSFLAELTGSQLIGDPNYLISGVEALENAQEFHASFCENPRYERYLAASRAGVVIVTAALASHVKRQLLVHANPSLAFQKLIELFIKKCVSGFQGIHPTAVIHETVQLGPDVSIGPYVTIDRNSLIGARTRIEAGVSVGAEVTIGCDCHFYPHVVIRERVQIGSRVIIQAGAIIGSDGFGFVTTEKGEHLPLLHLGTVVVEEDVRIGANTTIDRARFKETRIGRGTKIDNLVQIAHQVSLGAHNLLAAFVGIAGSVTTGDHVFMAGQVGVAGHLSIASGVIVSARSGISKTILKAGIYRGEPAIPLQEFNERFYHLRHINRLVDRLKVCEEKLNLAEKLPAESL
jgi:UDP-3-O-[3-hydroxymyristoyl] glucosamine N-acyltransferase